MYGNLKFNERTFLWEKLRCLQCNAHSPWMCFGDFNEILNQEENIGLRLHCPNKIWLFRKFLDEVGLMDIEVKGYKFTWWSNPRDRVITRERIDRILANWG